MIAFDDITKQKNLEIAIERSNKDLEQFASVAAHDLQEPLRTIVSFLDLLERRSKDVLDEKSKHYMDNVVHGARRMQVLINDLLAYSRIRSRGKPFRPVNMQELVTDVLDGLRETVVRAEQLGLVARLALQVEAVAVEIPGLPLVAQ